MVITAQKTIRPPYRRWFPFGHVLTNGTPQRMLNSNFANARLSLSTGGNPIVPGGSIRPVGLKQLVIKSPRERKDFQRDKEVFILKDGQTAGRTGQQFSFFRTMQEKIFFIVRKCDILLCWDYQILGDVMYGQNPPE